MYSKYIYFKILLKYNVIHTLYIMLRDYNVYTKWAKLDTLFLLRIYFEYIIIYLEKIYKF